MTDCNISSSNAISAAQFMLNLDNSYFGEEYQQESILWTFNVKHEQEYFLSLANGKISPSPDKALKEQLNESLLALSQYSKNMFNILTLNANLSLIQHLAKTQPSTTNNQIS